MYYTNKIIGSVVIAFALYLGSASVGYSQDIASHRLLENERGSERVDPYSLRNGITVKKALERISEKENLILSYDSDLLKSSDKILLRDNHYTRDKAIREILSDTELEYKIMKTRHLVIYDEGKIGHVKGKVVDAETRDYLQDAKLYLQKTDTDSTEKEEVEKVTYVDSTGKYDINNVDEGTYKLIVTFAGYEQQSESIEIHNKQTTEIIIELQRKK